VDAVARLVEDAVDRVLLSDDRVTSAADGKRRLSGQLATEGLADKVQRVVVLATPFVRVAARGAKFTRLPWAMIAASSVSVGIAVRTGVRELQVITSLVAYRIEQATGAPADARLVEKVAVDLYLNPKRKFDLSDDRLRLVHLTRKWVLLGAIGRTTSKRAGKALEAADELDGSDLAARWNALLCVALPETNMRVMQDLTRVKEPRRRPHLGANLGHAAATVSRSGAHPHTRCAQSAGAHRSDLLGDQTFDDRVRRVDLGLPRPQRKSSTDPPITARL
jgi:hypothetical protein